MRRPTADTRAALVWLAAGVFAMAVCGCRERPTPLKRAWAAGIHPATPATGDADGPAADGGAEAAAPPEPCGPGANRIVERGGNLYLCDPDGSSHPLTREGVDAEPSVSPDGKRVAFLRRFGKESLGDGMGTVIDSRVMVLDLASLVVSQAAGKDVACVSLSSPRFVFDDVILVQSYGYAEGSAHGRSVCAVHPRTHAMSQLARGTLCALPITAGRHRGSFFLPESQSGASAVENWWIVDRAGRVKRSFRRNPLEGLWGDDFDANCMGPASDAERAEAVFRSW